MFRKLDDLEKKFRELESKLSDPSVIGNQTLFQKIGRERSSLMPPQIVPMIPAGAGSHAVAGGGMPVLAC